MVVPLAPITSFYGEIDPAASSAAIKLLNVVDE
jgi:hypothetical protein